MENPLDNIDLSSLEQQNGLPSGWLSTVAKVESNNNPNAVSPAGAKGLFQFMDPTAQQYGIDPLDPQQAAQGAAQMYGELFKKYNGDPNMAAAAYNWGQGNVDRHGLENAPAETQGYISKIMAALPAAGKQVVNSFGVPQAQAAEMPEAVEPSTASEEGEPDETTLKWYLDGEKQGVLTPEEQDWLNQGRKAGFVPGGEATAPANAVPADNPITKDDPRNSVVFGMAQGARNMVPGLMTLPNLPVLAAKGLIGAAGYVDRAFGSPEGESNLAALNAKIKTPGQLAQDYVDQRSGGVLKPTSKGQEKLARGEDTLAGTLALGGGLIPGIGAGAGAAATTDKSPLVQLLATGAGGSVGAIAEHLVQTGGATLARGFTARTGEQATEDAGQIFKTGSQSFKDARQSGDYIQAPAMKAMVKDANEAVKGLGELDPELHSATLGRLTKLDTMAKENPAGVSIEQLHNQRQLLNEVIDNNSPLGKPNGDAKRVLAIRNVLDDHLEQAAANGSTGSEALQSGLQTWAAANRASKLAQLITKADGDPNKIKQAFGNFATNRAGANLKGYSAAEKAAILKAGRNSTGEKLLKGMGKFGYDIGGSRGGGNTVLPSLELLGGYFHPGLAGLAVGGTLARSAQKLIARAKAEDAFRAVESRIGVIK